MSALKQIFLTGTTGFLGSHLCWALLLEGHHVTALARSSKATSAKDRVADTLGQVAGGTEALAEQLDRLKVVEGDIAAPGLGLDRSELAELEASTDEVWHSAASLSFLDEEREQIFRMNLDGARNIIDLAAGTPGRRLQHVSTAYIAGKRTGIVLESEIDVGQEFKNPYEESKCRAELALEQAHRDGRVVVSVYRPSIVIGTSGSGRATHFHGVYAFIRGLWTAVRRLRRRQGGSGTVELPLRVLGSESTTLNFVPIDYVTDGMVAIAKQPGSAGRTYHLANPQSTENRLWLGIVCDQLGVEGIRFVDEESFTETPMTKLEALLHRQMAFYNQYLRAEPRFDCRGTLEALAGTPIGCPDVTEKFARKMTGWYIDMLNGKKEAETD